MASADVRSKAEIYVVVVVTSVSLLFLQLGVNFFVLGPCLLHQGMHCLLR